MFACRYKRHSEAKDLSSKSAEDMKAILGAGASFPKFDMNKNSSEEDNDNNNNDNQSHEKKEKKSKKKRRREEAEDDN